ncbi:unnamed protein product, partial [Pylaiella littoralis]
STGLQGRDRQAIGKAIVDRPGKDDGWVTTDTAGWTFAAATREIPEKNHKSSQTGEQKQKSNKTRFVIPNPRRRSKLQAQAHAVSGLIGTRELALLESRFRLAIAECRTESAGVLSSADDPGGDPRHRRPRAPNRGITSTVVLRLPAFEASDELGTSAAQGFDEEFPTRGEAATWRHREGELEAIGATTKKLRQVRVRIKRFRPPRPCPLPTPPATINVADTGMTKSSRHNPALLPKSSPRRDSAVTRTATGIRGGKMTPQRPCMGRNGGPAGGGSEDEQEDKAKDGRGKSGQVVALHRGLVITDELRKELLNPLAHRFKLLRGAH